MTLNKFLHFGLAVLLLIAQAQAAMANVPCHMQNSDDDSDLSSMMMDMSEMSHMDHSMHHMPSVNDSENTSESLALDCCAESGCLMSSCVSLVALLPTNPELVAVEPLTSISSYLASYSVPEFPPSYPPPIYR